jgi:hypothetical protein
MAPLLVDLFVYTNGYNWPSIRSDGLEIGVMLSSFGKENRKLLLFFVRRRIYES